MTLSPLAFDANWQKVRIKLIIFIHSILNLIFIEEKEEEIPDVDDTDGLDPAAEFEAWRLRELGRIKTETEAELQREKEREEVERRRAMPAEQRMKEDLERAQKLRDEKPKGQQKFLQKYWHKGAFHQVMHLLAYNSDIAG
jgi:microfibrillar-associated protein 1